jgi:hypothetical protein
MRTSVRKLLAAAALAVIALLPTDTARAGEPRAIAAIEDDLVADDPAVRAKAAAELTERFPDGATSVPMLVDLLDDESPEVVAAAAMAIDTMAIRAAAPLIEYLIDDRHWTESEYLKSEVSELTRGSAEARRRLLLLWSSLPESRMTAEQAVVMALTSRPKEDIRLKGYFLTGHDAPSAVPGLLRSLRNSASATRPLIAAALAMHAADELFDRKIAVAPGQRRSAAATSALMLVKDARGARAWAGARIQSRLRAPDEPVVAALTKLLAQWKVEDRLAGRVSVNQTAAAACDALGRIGPSAAPASAILEQAACTAEFDDAFVHECVLALLRMGLARDVVALLQAKPKTGYSMAQVLASERLAPSVVVPCLMENSALRTVASYGPDARAALPALRDGMRAPAARDTFDCAAAILAIDPLDAEAMQFVTAAIQGPDKWAKMWATDVLIRCAPPDASLVALIQTELARPAKDRVGDDVRLLEALVRCGEFAAPAVPSIVKVLLTADRSCSTMNDLPEACVRRARIVRVLGGIGPVAAAAVPTLESLQIKRDATLRVPAAQALRRIRAPK